MSTLHKYIITDPAYYSNKEQEFQLTLMRVIKKHKPEYICFRDKTSTNAKKLLRVFVECCKEEGVKAIINTYLQEAIQIKANGVHLTSKQFRDIPKAKKAGLFTVVSTHSIEEALHVKALGADAISFSPIFYTPKKAKPVGLEVLEACINETQMKVIALGGIITPEHVAQIAGTKAYAFASIRYFL